MIGFIGDVETIMVDKMMDSMERPPNVHPCYRKQGFGITKSIGQIVQPTNPTSQIHFPCATPDAHDTDEVMESQAAF